MAREYPVSAADLDFDFVTPLNTPRISQQAHQQHQPATFPRSTNRHATDPTASHPAPPQTHPRRRAISRPHLPSSFIDNSEAASPHVVVLDSQSRPPRTGRSTSRAKSLRVPSADRSRVVHLWPYEGDGSASMSEPTLPVTFDGSGSDGIKKRGDFCDVIDYPSPPHSATVASFSPTVLSYVDFDTIPVIPSSPLTPSPFTHQQERQRQQTPPHSGTLPNLNAKVVEAKSGVYGHVHSRSDDVASLSPSSISGSSPPSVGRHRRQRERRQSAAPPPRSASILPIVTRFRSGSSGSNSPPSLKSPVAFDPPLRSPPSQASRFESPGYFSHHQSNSDPAGTSPSSVKRLFKSAFRKRSSSKAETGDTSRMPVPDPFLSRSDERLPLPSQSHLPNLSSQASQQRSASCSTPPALTISKPSPLMHTDKPGLRRAPVADTTPPQASAIDPTPNPNDSERQLRKKPLPQTSGAILRKVQLLHPTAAVAIAAAGNGTTAPAPVQKTIRPSKSTSWLRNKSNSDGAAPLTRNNLPSKTGNAATRIRRLAQVMRQAEDDTSSDGGESFYCCGMDDDHGQPNDGLTLGGGYGPDWTGALGGQGFEMIDETKSMKRGLKYISEASRDSVGYVEDEFDGGRFLPNHKRMSSFHFGSNGWVEDSSKKMYGKQNNTTRLSAGTFETDSDLLSNPDCDPEIAARSSEFKYYLPSASQAPYPRRFIVCPTPTHQNYGLTPDVYRGPPTHSRSDSKLVLSYPYPFTPMTSTFSVPQTVFDATHNPRSARSDSLESNATVSNSVESLGFLDSSQSNDSLASLTTTVSQGSATDEEDRTYRHGKDHTAATAAAGAAAARRRRHTTGAERHQKHSLPLKNRNINSQT